MYDPKVGRWLSVDTLSKKFPWQSPYSAMDNTPTNKIDPNGSSGEVILDKKNGTLTVKSHIILYSSNPNLSPALASQVAANIQADWNSANGKVKINGKTYKVKFEITGEFREENSYFNTLASTVTHNTDIKNNFFRVETETDGLNSDRTTSYTDGTKANTGFFVMSQLGGNDKTESHEYGHTLGESHHQNKNVQGQPDIMTTQNNVVEPAYQENYVRKDETAPLLDKSKRKVTQQNIDDLHLDKLDYNSDGKANLGKLTNEYHKK